MFNFRKDIRKVLDKSVQAKPGASYKDFLIAKNKNLPIVAPTVFRIAFTIVGLLMLLFALIVFIVWLSL
jgi:hypothetical protein